MIQEEYDQVDPKGSGPPVCKKLSYAQVVRGLALPLLVIKFDLQAQEGKVLIPLEIIKITIEEGALNLVGIFLSPLPNIDDVQEWSF